MRVRPESAPKPFAVRDGQVVGLTSGREQLSPAKFNDRKLAKQHRRALARRIATTVMPRSDRHADAVEDHKTIVKKLKAIDVATDGKDKKFEPSFRSKDRGNIYTGLNWSRRNLAMRSVIATGLALAVHASPLDNSLPIVGESAASQEQTDTSGTVELVPQAEGAAGAEIVIGNPDTEASDSEATVTFASSSVDFECAGPVIDAPVTPADEGSPLKAWERAAGEDPYNYRNIQGGDPAAAETVLAEVQAQFGPDKYPTGCVDG